MIQLTVLAVALASTTARASEADDDFGRWAVGASQRAGVRSLALYPVGLGLSQAGGLTEPRFQSLDVTGAVLAESTSLLLLGQSLRARSLLVSLDQPVTAVPGSLGIGFAALGWGAQVGSFATGEWRADGPPKGPLATTAIGLQVLSVGAGGWQLQANHRALTSLAADSAAPAHLEQAVFERAQRDGVLGALLYPIGFAAVIGGDALTPGEFNTLGWGGIVVAQAGPMMLIGAGLRGRALLVRSGRRVGPGLGYAAIGLYSLQWGFNNASFLAGEWPDDGGLPEGPLNAAGAGLHVLTVAAGSAQLLVNRRAWRKQEPSTVARDTAEWGIAPMSGRTPGLAIVAEF